MATPNNPQQKPQSNPAPQAEKKPLAGLAISEEQIKAAHAKAAADLKLEPATGKVCLLATIRLLEHFGWVDAAQRRAAYSYLSQAGHGLGCNASALAQWTARKNEAKELAEAAVEC